MDEKLSYKPHAEEVHKKLLARWIMLCKYTNRNWGLNQHVMVQLIKALFMSLLHYAGHIWMKPRNMIDIDKLWYRILKTIVGAVFNIKLSTAEVILGLPPLSVQNHINKIKHFLKLNISQAPVDALKDYHFIYMCDVENTKCPVELAITMKEMFKYQKWMAEYQPNNFTEDEIEIIENQDYSKYLLLSPMACSYTKQSMDKYTEKLWSEKLQRDSQIEGRTHIPNPKCVKLPIKKDTPRFMEVLLMSLYYTNNLMNSFMYSATNSIESPLCNECGEQEETPFHVITACSHTDIVLKQGVEQELWKYNTDIDMHHMDCVTLLNASRSAGFTDLCLQILSSRTHRTAVTLD